MIDISFCDVQNTKGSVEEGLNEPISVEALEKNKCTNETLLKLDENSDLAHKTSLQVSDGCYNCYNFYIFKLQIICGW